MKIYENTFLDTRSDFLIYHSINSTSGEKTVSYLTPVLFEWVMQLNPIFYFNYLFDKK